MNSHILTIRKLLRNCTALFSCLICICGCTAKENKQTEKEIFISVTEEDNAEAVTESETTALQAESHETTVSSVKERHNIPTTKSETTTKITENTTTKIATETVTNENTDSERTKPEPDNNTYENHTKKTSDTVTNTISTTQAASIQTTAVTEETTDVIPDGKLVRILDYIPDAVIDLRYATNNNFTGEVIYDDAEAYLCYGTVKKLINVQEQLKISGYRILIWDAYRSQEAQWKLWNVYPDPNFVADPRNGITGHSRGNTIDITIATEDGQPVEMPSAFDEFASIADRDYSDVSAEAAANAQFLEHIMFSCGFTGYKGEWWDYSDTERYELIPISN